ncbi:MAG TPA: ribosome assembly RNA-binding protein YhbY [Thermoanaerobaculia bacterium]|jgi:RNA-binding protein
MALTPKQRQFLRGLAHPLAPVVRVGKGGVSDSVVAETKKSLGSHELIKVRIDVDEGSQRKELAARLAEATDADVAGVIGKTAILYRERDEEPEIELPE